MPLKARIQVCFYCSNVSERDRFVQWATRSDVIHCGIMVDYEDMSIVLCSDKFFNAKFINSKAFHERYLQPKYIVDLGEKDISVQQLINYIDCGYKGDFRSIAFWWFGGRYLFPTLIPKTCTLLTTQLLRICGYKIKDFVSPHQLLKEFKDATNYPIRTSRSGQDNNSSHDS